MREEKTKCYAGTFCEAKGVTPYVLKFMTGWLRRLGHARVILQTDGEQAIIDLKNELIKNLAPKIEVIP